MRFMLIPLLVASTVGMADKKSEIAVKITEANSAKVGSSIGLSHKITEMFMIGGSLGQSAVRTLEGEDIYRPDICMMMGVDSSFTDLVSMRQRFGYGGQSLEGQRFLEYFVLNLGLAGTLNELVIEAGVESRSFFGKEDRASQNNLHSYGSIGYRF